ncbi:dienelactone hydrolase family protein [Ornithinimicrobium sp. CNJ-824]|uniref:dienelactone hydrolase family protein n=1 Tax=Ornithinimicrobium sp. CNJ-824 TaxID=1904966 RepID=UPI0022A93663|nr:dienelactone hydrolase family protein [Ornithinimicrobium sp. CNJ-824]
MPEVDDLAVGLVGFCFGGGLAFDVAARAAQAQTPVAALVSFYGSALPGLLGHAEHVTCPSLHVFGTADSYIPTEQVEQIREAVTAGGTREQVRFELHEAPGTPSTTPTRCSTTSGPAGTPGRRPRSSSPSTSRRGGSAPAGRLRIPPRGWLTCTSGRPWAVR